tara:strand:+ start:583 stop:864 length:282 start_codon:yes stop_codon:yes gene_type:complete
MNINVNTHTQTLLLFGGIEFYARGGFNDFIGAYHTEQEALFAKNELEDRSGFPLFGDKLDWWHIFDIRTGRIVAGSREQAYGAADLDDAHQTN